MKSFLLTALLLVGLTSTALNGVWVPLAWDPAIGADAIVITASADGLQPVTRSVLSTNTLGYVNTNQVPNWPVVATLPGTYQASGVLLVPSRTFVCAFASNYWGYSLPSNVLPFPEYAPLNNIRALPK